MHFPTASPVHQQRGSTDVLGALSVLCPSVLTTCDEECSAGILHRTDELRLQADPVSSLAPVLQLLPHAGA